MRRCQLVVTGQSLFGGVHLEAVCQLVRAAQRGSVPAVDFVGGDAQTLPGDAAKEMQWKQAVVATDQDPRWVSGQALCGDGSIRASDWMRARFSTWAASSGGTSW
jgi:hypothetical protein